MLSFNDALEKILAWPKTSLAIENVPLQSALGRIVAQDIIAVLNLPTQDNSAMDGYAVKTTEALLDFPIPIQCVCYAGEIPPPLKPYHAMRLFTGALLPEGADAIVVQEDSESIDSQVIFKQVPKQQQHIRYRGEDVRAGQAIIKSGIILKASHLGLLAAQGLTHVAVMRLLKVSVMTTGDEIKPPGTQLNAAQIYNANAPMLIALIMKLGCEVVAHHHVEDSIAATVAVLNTLVDISDVVITVGGVSVGTKDHVKASIERLGQLDFWKVRMKPGKPVAMGNIRQTPIVALPGNPVSAYVVFTLLIAPFIRSLQGQAAPLLPTTLYPLILDKSKKVNREEFIRVQRRKINNEWHLFPYPQQGSAILSSLVFSDGMARLPADIEITSGQLVEYYEF